MIYGSLSAATPRAENFSSEDKEPLGELSCGGWKCIGKTVSP